GMTTLSMANFIAYSFAPTLIFNILLYLIFQKLFKKVYFNA
ncbi:cell shape-determining protein MreD, partial [Streptococcus sp. TATVAM-FAB21]